MRKLYLLVIMVMVTTACWSQYDRSAGVRLGRSGGLTIKKFIHAEEAIELLLSGRNSGLQLTGLYQFHRPLQFKFSDRFYLHYGVGGHFGYEKASENTVRFVNLDQRFRRSRTNQFTMGIDGIVGVEYRWLSVPITIGIDTKPYFDFIGMRQTRFRFWDSALSVKYVF